MGAFVDRALRSALAVVVDTSADEDDQVAGAWVVRCLLPRMDATEAMITDVAGALLRALDAPVAISLLATALRSGVVDRSRVAGAFARAADRAVAEQHLSGLHSLLIEMLDEPTWRDRVRDEHGVSALRWALDGLPERRTEALLFVGAWLRTRGSVPPFMREAVRARAELFLLLKPPPFVAWPIHCACPSAHSWIYLAGMREHERFAITRATFMGEIESAVATLDTVLDGLPDGAMCVILANWRARLAGP
jgi:hypothetical protein